MISRLLELWEHFWRKKFYRDNLTYNASSDFLLTKKCYTSRLFNGDMDLANFFLEYPSQKKALERIPLKSRITIFSVRMSLLECLISVCNESHITCKHYVDTITQIYYVKQKMGTMLILRTSNGYRQSYQLSDILN